MDTIEQLAAEVAALKAQLETQAVQHASMMLLVITQAANILVLTKFARQQGAKIDLPDLQLEAREILIRLEGASPELAAALDVELTKHLASDDSAR